MKNVGVSLFSILAIAVVLSGSALAQDNSSYFVTYFANNTAAAPDATVRFVNDGSADPLYASIYVFDDSQELTECCSCGVTADGLLSESVRNQLTKNPLTGLVPTRGLIKVISSLTESDVNTHFAKNTPTAGLRGWSTHIQSVANKYPTGPAPFSQTETAFSNSNLSTTEQSLLESLCYFDWKLSGKPCSCTQEDFDF